MITYDQARQYGKTYVGALNSGCDPFAELFAEEAEVRVDGVRASIDDVLEVAPPGRSGFRGARLVPPAVVLIVRVRDVLSVEDQAHRLVLDDLGRIVALDVPTQAGGDD